MSDSTLRLPARPSLEHLSNQAKDLLRQYRAGDRAALDRFRVANPRSERPETSKQATLADAQFVIAREYGFETWVKLKRHIEAIRPPGMEQFEQLAQVLAEAYAAGDAPAVRNLNSHYGTSFVWERTAAEMQRHLSGWFASENRTPELALGDARDIVAHSYGFKNWTAFTAGFHQAPANPRSASIFLSTRPPL